MNPVARHYRHGDLEQAILGALEAAGRDLDRLGLDDLAPVDEFHIRGREATREVADAIGLGPGARALDVGSGLGGPARRLAAEYGWRVTGLDLSEEYCRVAAALTARLGLQRRVEFRAGDALDLPFEDGAFQVVWSQHAAMNIADKARLYGEMFRVLAPGGWLGLYDVLAGPGGEVHYPVPWAREPAISFLVSPAELRRLLTGAGFDIVSWRDTTAAGRDWFRSMAGRGRPALGIHLVLGEDFKAMGKNQARNLAEERIVLMQVVARRPTGPVSRTTPETAPPGGSGR